MNSIQAGPSVHESVSGIYEWGIRVIEAFQNGLPSAARPLFLFFTLLGDPLPYIVIIAGLYWCFSEKRAAQCGIVLFVSAGINTALKEIFAVPRPFIRKQGINLVPETGYSTPSGHSQNAAAFWPVFFQPIRKHIVRTTLIITIPLLIGISRIYLGVHYPTDVLFGWAVGGSITVFTLVFLPRITGSFHSGRFQNVSAAPVSIQIAAVALGVFVLNIFSGSETRMSGVIFGFCSGYLLFRKAVSAGHGFSAAKGSLLKKAIRLVLGLAVIGAIHAAGEAAYSILHSDNLPLFRFVQYALAGFWITRIAPELFVRTGLQ